MILDVLKVAVIGLVALFLWDVWQLVRKQSSALDRDQDILDQITVYEPEPDDDAEVAGFSIDLDMNEADATLAFIEQFRAIKEQHGRNND